MAIFNNSLFERFGQHLRFADDAESDAVAFPEAVQLGLCIKNGEEKGFTATEFKAAQKDGWEKQYRYKVEKKKIYMTASDAQEKGYDRIDKHPKSSRYGRQNPISEQWNSDEQLCVWRANWADTVNEMLARNQINASIDHRSFADQGITEQPTIHEGYIAQNMEKKGMIADRCEINRQIRADNQMLRELKTQVSKLAQARSEEHTSELQSH